MKNANIIKWHGYGEGALPVSQVDWHKRTAKGDTLVADLEGNVYNCHPKAFKCGGETSWGYRPGNEMELIECQEGAYPIRWKLSKWELEELDLLIKEEI